MTSLDSILKSRDIPLPTKVRLVKAMVFPVVMCGCESWTIKEAEHQRSNAFELWCWRKLLRVPWTARRSSPRKPVHLKGNQPWVFIGKTDVETETPILWPPQRRADSLEKEMATHSSVLAWRIPGMGEPGGLPSMGLHRIGHD